MPRTEAGLSCCESLLGLVAQVLSPEVTWDQETEDDALGLVS